MKPLLSIIIPTLNEEARIEQLLNHLHRLYPGSEIIVVDGGSIDRTVEMAQELATCIPSSRGRGVQLNRGAKHSSGQILWFIHADCIPPANAEASIRDLLTSSYIVGGAFKYTYSDKSWFYRVVANQSNLKNRLLNRISGDMGIFVRREIFERMGGFREGFLMEDFDFSHRLKKIGRIKILPDKMETSPRQWESKGFMWKLLGDCMTKIAYQLGVDNRKLYNNYYKGQHDRLDS